MSVRLDFTVTACCEEDMMSFVRMLMLIQECGMRGCGAEFKVVVDGDGSGRYRFYSNDQPLLASDEGRQRLYKQLDKRPVTVWLGE